MIEIEDVDYVPIYVTAEIAVQGYYPQHEVEAQVKSAAGSLLAFENVTLRRPFTSANFMRRLRRLTASSSSPSPNSGEQGKPSRWSLPAGSVLQANDCAPPSDPGRTRRMLAVSKCCWRVWADHAFARDHRNPSCHRQPHRPALDQS